MSEKNLSIAIIGTKGYPFVYSGYETFVAELANQLKDKFKIHIYCQRALFKTRERKINGIYLHYIPSVQNKYLAHITHGLLCTIHALFKKFDIVFYLNVCYGPFGYICKWFRISALINTDGLEWLRPEVKKLGSTYYRWAASQATKAFNIIVSDSKAIANIYKKEFNIDTTVIAYGAHICYSSNTQRLKKYKLERDAYYLVVGRLFPSNNIHHIVKAFDRSHLSKKLVIVGRQFFPDRYEKEMKAYQSDRIIFTDFIEDQSLLSELYANTYCYIHGHEFGGTNPSLLNALAHGCCVIALDTPFNREVLLDKNYGLYFNKEPDSLIRMIRWIDRNPETVHQYRQKSRERILNQYTWEKIAAQYNQLFKSMFLNSAVP
ncbi:glycosyltransferase [bacterium]|nr:glycosyltransferase [bacterium]RQV93649.1 MAG: glycosyltransferase [bacterium]